MKQGGTQRKAVRCLDKKIRRLVKENEKSLRSELAEKAPEKDAGTLLREVKRLRGTFEVHTAGIEPKVFTSRMKELQPEHGSIVQQEPFKVPMAFAGVIEAAIKMSKKKKAPDLNKIRAEMLQLSAELFITTLTALWKSSGRLESVSSILQAEVLVPIYKKGDATDPGNYRPITLLHVFWTVINKSLSAEFRAAYNFYTAHWSYLRCTNTEVDIAAAKNAIRRGRNKLVVLDLSKAYDAVSRAKLLELSDHRLPTALSAQVSSLLAPTVLKTQGQMSEATAVGTVGVLQRDPISTLIFNLYMDPLL